MYFLSFIHNVFSFPCWIFVMYLGFFHSLTIVYIKVRPLNNVFCNADTATVIPLAVCDQASKPSHCKSTTLTL